MFIFDLLIYVFFAWIMYSLAKKSDEIYGEEDNLDGYLWTYMIFFAVISAIRWRVGTDCNNYIEIFQKGEIRPNSREFLWDALVRFVKVMDFHFTIGTGIVAFIQVFLLTYALKKYKYILIWFPVVLFGGRYFLDIMNGVRQMTVACGFVYLSTFIFNRQIFKYILGILILSGIHMSALILIPFYLVAFIPFDRLDLSNRRVLWLCVLIVCFFVGRLPAFQGLINYIEPVLSSTGYEYQSTYYRDLLSGKITEQLSFGPIMISYLLLSISVIWFGPVLYERFGQEIKSFNIWYFFSLIYSCVYFLFCNAGHMMIRPLQYFELFQAIVLSLLLYLFWSDKEVYRKYLYILVCIIWVCTAIGVYKASGQVYETVIYKTYFDHI